MKPILFHSVNLIIEIIRLKDADALDDLFCSLSNVLAEEEVEFVINEASQFITNVEPDLLQWWKEEILDMLGDVLGEKDGKYYLKDAEEFEESLRALGEEGWSDSSRFISKEEEKELEEELRTQLEDMGEDLSYFPCYQVDESEKMYANITDVIHVLLDEGLTDYKLCKGSIFIGPTEFDFLRDYYELDKFDLQFVNEYVD